MTITYDNKTPRQFMIASLIWGLVAMLVGIIAASQLSWWQANGKFLETLTFGLFKGDGVEYITFGRLRPLHTNAAIFAFVGNMMFAGIYYSTQRLCKCRTASDLLSKIHFWGWQLIILGAAITLPLGLTQSKEYAELIWPLDIAVALIWVVFGWNFFWTLAKRNEPSLYVALWFYIATIITVAMLYIVNNLQIPTSLTHSYSIFGGLQDALVQWWYGHNAVAFFLTTPILGIMYYFLPKAANRPVYSYRLSIVHFWSLVFIYIWAGPHHLLNTALPRWLQMLGMLFSLMLWAPSWGGMLNGLLTLRTGWAQLRTDPVIKFFAVGVTFYGMATFEGPLLAIRAVNELSHYTDWTIGHVHAGTLGWNGMMAAGMFYWMAPRLWKSKLWSESWANMHFWIALVGILLYVGSMWTAGILQGLMLGELNEGGTGLKYQFVQTLQAINGDGDGNHVTIKSFFSLYAFRTYGGILYIAGFIMCAINIFMTVRGSEPAEDTIEVPETPAHDTLPVKKWFGSEFLLYVFCLIFFLTLAFFLPSHADKVAILLTFFFTWKMVVAFKKDNKSWSHYYDQLLENYLPFTFLTFIAVALGGVIQIIPSIIVNKDENIEGRLQELYTPLELAGRDTYIAEGCYNCHSQMIRTLKPDVMRYGRDGIASDYSHLGESLYDHPFQWGSKRTGPDLAREGGPQTEADPHVRIGKRDNLWHFNHFLNPRQTSPGSNMPAYPWLFEQKTDFKAIPGRIKAQVKVGVPFPPMDKHTIEQNAREQALAIAKTIEDTAYLPSRPDLSGPELTRYLSEQKIISLIAYIQKLGAYKEQTLEDGAKPKILDPDTQRTAAK
ncbi:cytochrome-c oxidase, cbb3-type subunit I [Roseibacillus persicicus]|uniref:cytochrome-c oxidase n=1 Tax=Roseibacillus persicicus TaxID=454148 RepID=A0A918TD14_9BACT|nr:cytochrome-c oxidase, cbb3-type subunit I [Roseibacillus persicicus]GHC41668.1 bifunctional cbb3-type cytochrome C oxidase subunit I/II [Roseibacillus persicicus]